MREITKLMVKDFRIMKLGYDFAGYQVKRKESLSFHHLIVPRRLCGQKGLGKGYLYWNGAILRQDTSHDYLHLIESKDYDRFLAITSEIIDENIKGYLDIDNLRKIADILRSFEKEYCSARTKKGKMLIKEEFIKGRMIR